MFEVEGQVEGDALYRLTCLQVVFGIRRLGKAIFGVLLSMGVFVAALLFDVTIIMKSVCGRTAEAVSMIQR